MEKIDADKLLAEIEQLNSLVPYENNDRHDDGLHDAYKAVKNIIASLEQEAVEERKERERVYHESWATYWRCVINNIDNKRVLPTFKGQLLHDFKNELHTMKQIIGLINHPEIHEGLLDKLALVFAAWGGYHFHPSDTPAEDSLDEEQQEISLEKFSEKMDAWKARYNYPDNIPIKAAMAFTARMFYMYPNVAKEWYDNLPKVTMD